ncbi:hypothetical protein UFOVP787_53 [uncultured Caudovirales phage]|uniref:Uncharacterized protein n=1 Tax=uncultured Caudovirales phage TaxID=2100421 RepID=A0A6J5NUN0_9CAUD|nr:hypothetical protein UFOVP787_53 [uncultured Caudovirales phage]
MKKYLILPLFLILAACNTPQVISSQKITVIIPDESLFNCPTLSSFPNPEKLTDVQVARLILELYKDNQICKNSLESIKAFLEEAKRKAEAEG